MLTLMLLALCTIAVVGMLFLTETDRMASRNTVDLESARNFAMAGVGMATGLISSNSQSNSYVTYQVITDPAGGTPGTAFSGVNGRLETRIARLEAVNSAKFWELTPKDPVALHSGFAAPGEDGADLNFPSREDANVGFIAPRTNLPGSGWQNLAPDKFRMKWINVYKDNDSSKPANLIGRFAFWVDDESSKFNLNHSGSHQIYAPSTPYDYKTQWNVYVPPAKLPYKLLEWQMDATGVVDIRHYPWYQDFSAVRGLSRGDAYWFLENRREPWIANPSTLAESYKPLSTPLGVRFLSVDSQSPEPEPALGTLMKQSEMLFTATVYSSEEERTTRDGRLRANLLDASNTATPAGRKKWFADKLTALFPEFAQKYDIDQFSAAAADFIDNNEVDSPLMAVKGAGDKPDALGLPTPYTSPGASSYSAEVAPRLNEIVFQIYYSIAGNDLTIRNVVSLEFVNLYRLSTWFRYAAPGGIQPGAAIFPIGLELPSAVAPFPALPSLRVRKAASDQTVFFDSPAGGRIITPDHLDKSNKYKPFTSNLPLKANLSDSTCVLTYENTKTITLPAGAGSIALNRPETPVATAKLKAIVKSGLQWLPYMTVTLATWGPAFGVDPDAASPTSATPWMVPHEDTGGEKLLMEYSLEPDKDHGVNGDPRLGVFSSAATLTYAAPAPIPATPTHSLGAINPLVFRPTATSAFSGGGDNMNRVFGPGTPTPVGQEGPDGGFGVSDGWRLGFYPMPAMLGDLPVYRYENGNHLSWTTPRLWGTGRTNFNGQVYPPDWWLLDVFSTNWYAKPGGGDNTSYGKININTLKSYFNTLPDKTVPGGANYERTAASIYDSLFLQIPYRDFHFGWDPWYASLLIENPEQRKFIVAKLLEVVNERNSQDKPFASAAEALAFIAGPNFSPKNLPGAYQAGQPIWSWYHPNSDENNLVTGNNDRRVEGIVRMLNNRITTKGNQFSIHVVGQALRVLPGKTEPEVLGETCIHTVYERAPEHDETGAISNGVPMRQLFFRELRY